jgi:hypothetical protein
VGRRGNGPGEFQSLISIVWLDESLYAFDIGRLHVFGSSFDLVRSTSNVAAPQRPRSVGGSRVLGLGRFGSSNPLANFPAYVFDMNTGAVTPVGEREDPDAGRRCGYCTRFTASPAADQGSAWLAAANRYQLRKISLETGVPLRQVDVIRSHWFAEWDSAGMWALGVAPRPSSIVSVREDNEGLLWVLGSRSAAGWTPTPRPSTPDFEVRAAAGVAGREIGEWQAAINAKLESVVDVIDPTSGSLLGSLKLPGNLHQLTSELYYTTREIATSEVVVTVFRITLRRQ